MTIPLTIRPVTKTQTGLRTAHPPNSDTRASALRPKQKRSTRRHDRDMRNAVLIALVAVALGAGGGLLDRDASRASEGDVERAVRNAVERCPDVQAASVDCELRAGQWHCDFDSKEVGVFGGTVVQDSAHVEVSVIC